MFLQQEKLMKNIVSSSSGCPPLSIMSCGDLTPAVGSTAPLMISGGTDLLRRICNLSENVHRDGWSGCRECHISNAEQEQSWTCRVFYLLSNIMESWQSDIMTRLLKIIHRTSCEQFCGGTILSDRSIFSRTRDELTKLANVPAHMKRTPLLFTSLTVTSRVGACSVLSPLVQTDQHYWEESFVFMISWWTFPSNTMKTLVRRCHLVLTLLLSNQTYHHWNLIGWYAQVRGGGDSVALLDSLALSSIGGGVCSCWRHEANVFLLWLYFMTHSSTASGRRSSDTHLCYTLGYRFRQKVCEGEKACCFYFT